MPIVCRNVPNRTKKRVYKLKDAARIYCIARENDGLDTETARRLFEHEVNLRCGWGSTVGDVDEAKREAYAKAAELMEEILEVIPWARLGKKITDLLRRLPSPFRDRLKRLAQDAIDGALDRWDKIVAKTKEALRLPGPPSGE